MNQPDTEQPRELGARARAIATVVWSGFLAAALATMLCFALLDPMSLRAFVK